MTPEQQEKILKKGFIYHRSLLKQWLKIRENKPEDFVYFIKFLEMKIEIILIFLFQGCPPSERLRMFQLFQTTIAHIYEHVEEFEEK